MFQKPKSHLKILVARRVTCSRFNTEGPQILGATVQNIVARANWHPVLCTPDVLRLTHLLLFSILIHFILYQIWRTYPRNFALPPCSRENQLSCLKVERGHRYYQIGLLSFLSQGKKAG